jgi:hypothetical protein
MAAVCECLLNGCRFASSILPMHYISKRRHVIIFSKMASTRLPLKTSSVDVCLRRGRATPKVAAPLVTSCLFEMGNDYRSILKHFPQLLMKISPEDPTCRITLGVNGRIMSLNQHCNIFMESHGIVNGDFGLTVFTAASFDSVKALFFSPKLGYEALTSLPKDMFFGSGEQLSTVLAIMDSHGVPAEATFYKLQSGDTFRIPPKFNFLLFCIFVSK